jgi:hypothetical protein
MSSSSLSLQEWLEQQTFSFSPLFVSDENRVVQTIQKHNKTLLRRHPHMEEAMIRQVEEGLARKDWLGYLYIMCHGTAQDVEPLYIGMSSRAGKTKDINSNIANIRTDRQKFGRWGDGNAYHIGDLSQSIFENKGYKNPSAAKKSWASVLFSEQNPLRLARPVSLLLVPWYQTSVTPSGKQGASLAEIERELIALGTEETDGRLLNIVDVPWWHTHTGEQRFYQFQRELVYIEQLQELHAHQQDIAKAPYLGLDVETKPYTTHLCLVQIATPEKNYVIDVLKIPQTELQSSLQTIFNTSQPIIIHNASFERRICRAYGVNLREVIDTLTLSRARAQGKHRLQDVCERELSIFLSKEEQCSDWSRRPLSQSQLSYAATDAEVLLLLHAHFANTAPQRKLALSQRVEPK